MQDKATAKKGDELTQLVQGLTSNSRRQNDVPTASQIALQKDADKLEKKLAAYQAEANLVTGQLADPTLYVTPNSLRLLALTQRQSQLKRQIDETEALWMEVQELMESAS